MILPRILSSRACSTCSAPLSARSRSDRCRRCTMRALNASPEFKARKTAGIRKWMADPANRAKRAKEVQAHHRTARKDPEKAARLNRNIYKAREKLSDPAVAEKRRLAVLAGQAKRHETLYAWCPVERREEYRRLLYSKRLPAAEAKAKIIASLTLFERQMQAVRSGASLVSRDIARWGRAHAR